MIKVVIEDGRHILYQDGERFNYLTETLIKQDGRHHATNKCEVRATIACWRTLPEGLELPSFLYINEALYTPEGQQVVCWDVLQRPAFDSVIDIVSFTCDAVLTTKI